MLPNLNVKQARFQIRFQIWHGIQSYPLKFSSNAYNKQDTLHNMDMILSCLQLNCDKLFACSKAVKIQYCFITSSQGKIILHNANLIIYNSYLCHQLNHNGYFMKSIIVVYSRYNTGDYRTVLINDDPRQI